MFDILDFDDWLDADTVWKQQELWWREDVAHADHVMFQVKIKQSFELYEVWIIYGLKTIVHSQRYECRPYVNV